VAAIRGYCARQSKRRSLWDSTELSSQCVANYLAVLKGLHRAFSTLKETPKPLPMPNRSDGESILS